MKCIVLVVAAFFFLEMFSGQVCTFAQTPVDSPQIAGDEFGHFEPEGFSDSQVNLLWEAYNEKSDSLLAKFFNSWRLETQVVEEPLLDSPINNAIASLYFFLMNSDFQNLNYGYKYAVIQDQIEATVPSTSWSSQSEYVLRNFHPQSSDPNHPILILLDDIHNQILSDFFGDWSEVKAEAARNFFGSFVPFGADIDYHDNQPDWSLVRHWYSFAFTPDLQEASVVDQTPSGPVEYTCIVGPGGNWMKVSDETILTEPPESSESPVITTEPSPPVQFPWRPHHPLPTNTYVPPPAVPSGPASTPEPTGRPRPVATPTHPTSPLNPVRSDRPRQGTPEQHSPAPPQTQTQPERTRVSPPSAHRPTSPQGPGRAAKAESISSQHSVAGAKPITR